MKVKSVIPFVLLINILLVVPIPMSPTNLNILSSWSIICRSSDSLEETVENQSHFLRRKSTEVLVENCPPPQTSYAACLQKVGFDVMSIESLVLRNSPLVKRKHLIGLPIKKLTLCNSNGLKNANVEEDFLNAVPYLSKLHVHGLKIPQIPLSTKIVEASLNDGLFTGVIGTCEDLRNLSLSLWEVPVENFLASCTHLKTLRLSNMLPRTAAKVIHDTKYLTHLSIDTCQLVYLQKISFNHMKDLINLQLNNNLLQDLKLIPFSRSIRELYLNDNFISVGYHEIVRFFHKLPQLRHLEVANNKEFNFCKSRTTEDNNNNVDSEPIHPHLESLVLTRTLTRLRCLHVAAFPSLRYLDLRDQNIQIVQELKISNVVLEVNLGNNSFTEVNLTKIDYEDLILKKPSIDKVAVILRGSMKVDCDCRNGWFAAALRDKFLLAPGANCINSMEKTHLSHIPPDQLQCDKFLCEGCTCRRCWKDNFVDVDCSNTKSTEIPNITSLRRLAAPFNRIVLQNNDIPDSLIFLDLRSNEIFHVDEEVTKVLFSVRERQMFLSGNPILCDCENFVFIQHLQKFNKQVKDYEDVKCAGNGTAIQNVILSDLCQAGRVLQATLMTGGAVVLAAVLTTVVYWRYGKTIHMFLYARGWLCCINGDKKDAERLYDAFVSYCHMDVPVAEEIVLWLEERGFKVCVHYRDWMPGEMIPTQIVRSVEVSRRTVILLSKQFSESMWGLLEFRMAHARALKEGVMRVILVVLDDVVDNAQLDEDLRSYIRLNTYVRYDDPLFWDKLYYAMPRRHSQSNESTKFESVRYDGSPNLPTLSNNLSNSETMTQPLLLSS